jgi:hypothetical protein
VYSAVPIVMWLFVKLQQIIQINKCSFSLLVLFS